jgi:dipeptidyl aminopeptidase/acylaminoacyl peptidase
MHRTTSLVAALAALIPIAAEARGQVPDSIVAEGVPAVSKELKAQLRRYQNARSASFQGWLGGRREVLIGTRFADTNQVHRVLFPGGARTQLTFFADRVLGADPNPTSTAFAFSADEGGAENYQVFVQDADAGVPKRLTDGASRNVLAGWSNGGTLLGFSSNARNGKDMDLYVVEPGPSTSPRRLKEVSGDWSIADWSPDDRHVAAVEYISANESYVHIVEVPSGETRPLTPRSAPGVATVSYGDVRFSKDGRALFWTTDLDSEFRRLVRYDLANGQASVLTANIPWDVEGYDLSDDGRTIVLTTNEDGLAKLHILDIATGAERPAPAIPAGQIGGLDFRRGTQEFGFTLSSARATGDVYSYDLASDRLERWTASETGGIDASKFAEPELVHYPTFDGRQIPAFVYKPGPKFSGPRPVLIDIHGGPEGQFRPAFMGRLNYLIDELGIAVVFPNVRGSAGYGKSYLKLDNGFLREDTVKDIGALLDWIKTQPGLDASRVGVIGGSYGGYMSLATMTHYSDRLKCGIDIVGISNFVTFLKNTQGYRRDLRRAEYGDERDPKMREHLDRISPLTDAAKIAVPILVVQGKNDPRVPVTEAEQIVAAIRKGNRPVWYVLGKDEGHGFAKKVNQDYLMAAEVLFLRRHLLGDEARP